MYFQRHNTLTQEAQLWSRLYGNLLSWDATDQVSRSQNLFLPMTLEIIYRDEYNKIINWAIINWPLSPTNTRLGLLETLNIYLYRDLPTADPWEAWFDFESYLWYPLVLYSNWSTCYLRNPAENHQTNLIISTGHDQLLLRVRSTWTAQYGPQLDFILFFFYFWMSKMSCTCL